MSLRSVIAAAESILADAGYSRAADNFTLERVPASVAHLSYTLGRLELRPRRPTGPAITTAPASSTPPDRRSM